LVDYEKISQTDPDFIPMKPPDLAAVRMNMEEASERDRQQARQRLIGLSRRHTEELRAWWIRRMIVTPRPLEEKMTLFWHGLFTSGEREVRGGHLLARQNALLRAHALGSFRDLLLGISKDPAMLRYLDNASNRKGHPNENYARELMELFTMGEGNYTEKDVTEAARALTGWAVTPEGEFRVVRRAHDDGSKTLLGATGNFGGEDVIDIILKQKATPRHLATRLIKFFVQDEPPADLVDALTARLRKNKYDLRDALRGLFKSEAFYSNDAVLSQIKSPVELIVGTLRRLEIEPQDFAAMVFVCRNMGQDLFQPPNVKGWDGGRDWITTATLFTRYNVALALVRGTGDIRGRGLGRALANRFREAVEDMQANSADYPGLYIPPPQVESSAQPPYDPLPILESSHLTTPDQVVDHFVQRLLGMPITAQQHEELREVLLGASVDRDDAEMAGWKPSRERVVALLIVIMSMPEYQLN
ncbi:MAG TPA: DUF1800 domain-containing protein, partial [Phycisphaerae bacterium]